MTVATKNKPKSKSENTDLGELKVKDQIRVLMLPSDAKTVIVNYSHASALQLTCSFVAKTREVSIRDFSDSNTKKLKLRTPPLLMSVKHADIPTINSNYISKFFIWGFYNRDKTMVWAAPYLLSNVYENGAICFGGVSPRDLRSAYNLFWSAPFNPELLDIGLDLIYGINEDDEDMYHTYEYNLKSFMSKYKDEIFTQQDWEDYTEIVCGSKYWATSNPTDALLVTKDKGLLKQIPKDFRRKQGGQALFIAKAKLHKNVWTFDSGTVKFKLPKQAVVTGIPKDLHEDDDCY